MLITGASSGIGKSTARLFAARGWNVAATMRHPERESELSRLPNVSIFSCDVTDYTSITRAVAEAIERFGRIDVLVNNAGYDAAGPLEGATEEQVRRQVETNLTGTILMAKALVPCFRKAGGGTIINISSVAGRLAMPLQSLYHATKWGVEGFSESLQYELAPFGIHVRIIEPGLIDTDFYERSMTRTDAAAPEEYRASAGRALDLLRNMGVRGSNPDCVAETVFQAANSRGARLRYRVGKGSGVLVLQKLIPSRLFRALIARFSAR